MISSYSIKEKELEIKASISIQPQRDESGEVLLTGMSERSRELKSVYLAEY